MKRTKVDKSANDEKKARKKELKYQSVQVGGETLNTVAGPIHEWLCIPENLPRNPTMAFYGKRRTGKSTTITNIACHCMKDVPFGMVMSDTAYAGYWDKIIPKQFIVQGLSEPHLQWLRQRQMKLISEAGGRDNLTPEQEKAFGAFVIFDDVISDQKVIRWEADLQRFFVEGRHLLITVFIASQYVKGLGPTVRTNCDYVFLQPIYNKTQRDMLWDLEAGFMDKNSFNVLMDEIIQRETLEGNTAQDPKKKVRIMVCADFEDSNNAEEKFFHFTPLPLDLLPPFRLCHEEYWKQARRHSQFQSLGHQAAPVYTELVKSAKLLTRVGGHSSL